MGKNEAGVISDFKKTLRDVANASGRHFDEFPLGPQDRHVLADDFWVTYDHFAIVESKWSEDELRSEVTKRERVQALCEALQDNPRMAALHGRCHRVAWRDSTSRRLMSQEYRKIVCRDLFPETCRNLDYTTGTMAVDDFAKGFFREPPLHCVSAKDFQTYVRWLTGVITGTERTITVLARKKDAEGYTVSDEESLESLCKWLPSMPSNKAIKKKAGRHMN